MEENDWQVNRTPQDCAKYLLENELYTDVEFQVGEEGTLIKAHKIFMAQRSPVFEKMFYGLLAESIFPIKIMDVEPEAFRAMLRYIYYGQKVEFHLAAPTLYVAKKYMVTLLEDACRTLLEVIDSDNIWEIFSASLRYPDEKIIEACKKFFGSGVVAVELALNSSKFLRISDFALWSMLDLNAALDDVGNKTSGVLISEIKLFEACMKWAAAECERQEKEPSAENKRMVLGDCVGLIQFKAMLPKDIQEKVFPTDILSEEEKNELLEHANSPTVSLGPNVPYYNVQMVMQSRAQPLQRHSHIRNCELPFSSITVGPNTDMILKGITILVPDSDTSQSKHEVYVKQRNRHKTKKWTKEVLARNERLGAYTVKYLEIEDTLLDVTTEIKVEQTQNEGDLEMAQYLPGWGEATVKSAVQVDLELCDMRHNACIMQLSCCLV